MEAIETALDVPRVHTAWLPVWFRRDEGFAGVEPLAAVAERGAPVHIVGDTGIRAALAYYIHSNVAPHVDSIPTKKN